MSKMKKLLVSLCALLAVCTSANAQGMTATLQQGDKMTPYYGPDAFIQAYNAAPQKGAIITLSAGTFNTVDSIMKQVKIIGNGYKDNKTVIDNELYVKADNVTVEGVELYLFRMKDTENLVIRRCKIFDIQNREGIIESYKHKNTIVDQCIITSLDGAIGGGENYCIKNSIINSNYQGAKVDQQCAYITNCVFILCVNFFHSCKYKAIFKNNLISLHKTNDLELSSFCDSIGMECYNNVFVEGTKVKFKRIEGGMYACESTIDPDTRWTTPELNHEETLTWKNNTSTNYNAVFGESDEENPLLAPIITTIKGDDGTVVGPYGGTGFSVNPSIPRIADSKIDSNTDADGKLNVKIKVEVNQ